MIDSFRRALAVAAALTVVFVLSVLDTGGLDRANLARDLTLLALNTLPLLVVHRNPLVVVLTFSVAYPLWLDAGHEPHMFQSLPTLVALYAVGAWSRPLWLRALGLVAPAWMMAAVAIGWWSDPGWHEVGYVAVMFVLGWGLGAVVAARRSYAQQLEEKTRALEVARQELAERAVADERARIARELHDVIAHAMSVITVRAGVGSHLLTSRPAEAAEALEVIERTGREALSEMRRMLAVLRDPDPRGPRADPQPGLADLPQLLEQVGTAGVPVAVTTEGDPRPLSPGLDVAAYRVLQEALTNVVKHAPGARTSVMLRHRPDALELEVRSAGPDPVGQGTSRQDTPGRGTPGQGMRGMAERVALYDGQLEAGPEPDGFRVLARFPLAGREVEA